MGRAEQTYQKGSDEGWVIYHVWIIERVDRSCWNRVWHRMSYVSIKHIYMTYYIHHRM
jgi:hypothetical protein